MVAIIKEMKGDQVTIIRKGGAVFTVPKSLFSENDQKYFRSWDLNSKGLPEKLDEQIQPGTEVVIPFPDLPKMMHGGEAEVRFRVPENFSYPNPVPVFVWMNGGKGGNRINTDFFPKEDFLLIGLPFPETSKAPKDCFQPGGFDELLNYQQTMLDKVFELVPNIDKRLCAMGGFSNGAHSTCAYICEEQEKYGEFFNAIIVIDGGGRLDGNVNGIKDRHVYYGFASEGSHIPFQERQRDNFFSKADKDTYVEHQFPGGHAFPADVKEKVKQWCLETVIPERLVDAEEDG